MQYTKSFKEITIQDVGKVGGKNASLGEMIRNFTHEKIRIPNGFVVTADAYWYFLKANNLVDRIAELVTQLQSLYSLEKLHQIGSQIRSLIEHGTIPDDLAQEIIQAYKQLSKEYKQRNADVAVRSSATAEDLPTASFAGQQETFLNVRGDEELLKNYKKCLASLFTDRAIVYRTEHNFDHMSVALSVGIQKMVRSDKACSGVVFTLDTESGFRNSIITNASWGLGETIVKGLVTPDEYVVHKQTVEQGFKPIVKKKLGVKKIKMQYARFGQTRTVTVNAAQQRIFCLSDAEIIELARMALIIENYYSRMNNTWTPMDIEWAKDGDDGELYIVQARPETVHAKETETPSFIQYSIEDHQKLIKLLEGQSIGTAIATGRVNIARDIRETKHFKAGDILVTTMTDPDWVPLMKQAAAIITEQGGRTSHAAIVSRELGIPAIVGAANAQKILKNGQAVTVDCGKGTLGYVYDGALKIKKHTVSLENLPHLSAHLYVNCAHPEQAYMQSRLPVDGVGLARTEFIINDTIQMHPMVACQPEKVESKKVRAAVTKLISAYADAKTFFIQNLAQGVGTIAAAFYPRPVIVRFSDFKSNEYRNLLGGTYFEPVEENPMLGLRGASRYYSDYYKDAFALECAALKKVREEMGFTNVIVMIPFVRTVEEAQKVLAIMSQHGLKRGDSGLKVYMMCELPSNVLLLEKFATYFDGFSIGSNDLTQTTLAVDRDSQLLAPLFNEQDPAVIAMLSMALEKAHQVQTPIGICGQAPSDYPQLAQWLLEKGISSLSLNPDSVISFLLRLKK